MKAMTAKPASSFFLSLCNAITTKPTGAGTVVLLPTSNGVAVPSFEGIKVLIETCRRLPQGM